jgi:hypothetical protein
MHVRYLRIPSASICHSICVHLPFHLRHLRYSAHLRTETHAVGVSSIHMPRLGGLARHALASTRSRVVLAVCIVALLAGPLLPHAPVCHLKAATDCAACTLNALGIDVGDHGAPGTAVLTPQMAQPATAAIAVRSTLLRSAATDRSPPA